MPITSKTLQFVDDEGNISALCSAEQVSAIISIAHEECLVTFGTGAATATYGHNALRKMLSDALSDGHAHPDDLPMVTFPTPTGKASVYFPAIHGLVVDDDVGVCVVVAMYGLVPINDGIEDAFKRIEKRQQELNELLAKKARQQQLAMPPMRPDFLNGFLKGER